MPTVYAQCKTTADFRKLAQAILRERADGTPWADPKLRKLVSNARTGRDVLREYGKLRGKKVETGNGIAPSYPRTDDFKQAESKRRLDKIEASKPKPRKKATKKATAK
jgi:hypothetical protein